VFPKSGVTLFFTIAKPTGAGTDPYLGSYDPATGIWSPVPSHFDPARRTVSALVHHFSIWSVLRFIASGAKAVVAGVLNSLVGEIRITGPKPSCAGNDVTVSPSPNDGTMRACGQSVDATHALVKVASYLAFPTDVVGPTESSTTVVPSGDIYDAIVQELNTIAAGKAAGRVVPGGSEADVTLSVAPGASTTLTTNLDTVAYLAAIIHSGFDVLGVMARVLGQKTSMALKAISTGTCAGNLSVALQEPLSLSASTLKSLASVGFSCARQVLGLGVTGLVASAIALVASLFEDIVQTGFLAVETAVGWKTGGSHTLTVNRLRSAAPVGSEITGTWTTHDGSLFIYTNGTGTISWPDYGFWPVPGQLSAGNDVHMAAFKVTASTPTSATIVLTSITEQIPGDDPGPPVGSMFMLTVAPPGITIAGPFAAQMPNAYCDAAEAAQDQCGA